EERQAAPALAPAKAGVQAAAVAEVTDRDDVASSATATTGGEEEEEEEEEGQASEDQRRQADAADEWESFEAEVLSDAESETKVLFGDAHTLDLHLCVRNVQDVLFTTAAEFPDESCVRRVLEAYLQVEGPSSGEAGECPGSISPDLFRSFLQRFGPLRCAFEKAYQALFRSNGRKRVNVFSSSLSRAKADRALRQNKGTFLVRFSKAHPCKLILSHCYDDTVRHIGLRNCGVRGYHLRSTSAEGETPFSTSLRSVLGRFTGGLSASQQIANPVIRELAPPKCLAQRVLTFEELGEQGEEQGQNESRVEPGACACPDGVPDSPSVVVHCEACGKTNVAIAVVDSDNDPITSFGMGLGTYTNPEELDYLLRKGAEKFRTNRRARAHELFSRVLEGASRNVAYHRDFAEELSSSPLNVKHDARAAWCKCLSCSSLRAFARALGNLGHIASDNQATSEAVDLYRRSLPVLKELGMWKQEPIVLSSLTQCAFIAEDRVLGSRFGVEYLGTFTQYDERSQLLKRLENLGCFHRDNLASEAEVHALLRLADDKFHSHSHGPIHALGDYNTALAQARWLNNDLVEVNALIRVGCCLHVMHRVRDAIVHFERAVLLLRSNNLRAENRNMGRKRVDLHNLALSFAKKSTALAGWTTPPQEYFR
ncbi:Hypothetical protein SCF082_LOCUS14049, partial [Durusdinium trenchii]